MNIKAYSIMARNLLIVVGLSWALPATYSFFADAPVSRQFIIYSPIGELFTRVDNSTGKNRYMGPDNREFTEKEYDALHPTIFTNQLVADDRFPTHIMGREVTAREVKQNSFFMRHQARDINKTAVQLYPLLESRSKRVNLEMPGDLFRVSGRGIEFIDMESNTVNREKSELFQAVFEQKGFHFPARSVWGNPTTRKEYDEGYLIVDNEGALFHLKQVVGQPYLKPVSLPVGMVPDIAFVTEHPSKRTLAFVIDTEGHFYRLMADAATWQRIEGWQVDPRKEGFALYGNPFVWTVVHSKGKATDYYAVNDADFTIVDKTEVAIAPTWRDKLPEWLFPYRLSFTSGLDHWVTPRIVWGGVQVLVLNALLVLAVIVMNKRRNKGTTLADILLTLTLGIYYAGMKALVSRY
ncbi:MAG: DUF4857 domain-containing protein [Marinifilaceae bacterium]